MNSADDACLTSIAQGDQAAMSELYERYYPRLSRYLWFRLHGDAPSVDEALQDTFVAVWRSAGTFRGECTVATWIFRIAQRCSIHIGQRRSQQPKPLSFTQIQGEGETASSGHEEQTLTRIALQEVLLRLPDKQREVALLVLVHRFTSEEAAKILQVPSGTVRSRLRAARASLLNDPALRHIEEVSS